MGKLRLFADPASPSSCPRSCWMAPKTTILKKDATFWNNDSNSPGNIFRVKSALIWNRYILDRYICLQFIFSDHINNLPIRRQDSEKSDMTGTKKLYCAETAECMRIWEPSIDRRSFDEIGLIFDYDCIKIWTRGRAISKVFGLFDNLYDFLSIEKIRSNLQYKISNLSFDTQFAYFYENLENIQKWNVEAKNIRVPPPPLCPLVPPALFWYKIMC